MSEIKRFEANSLWSVFGDPNGSYVDYDDHAAIVAKLESQLAEAKKDQALYQGLKNNLGFNANNDYDIGKFEVLIKIKSNEAWCLYDEKLDQAIDAAIASIQETGK